jgi:hypothetical protein
MWILAYLLVEIDDFLKVPHLMWTWGFVDSVPNSPKNKNPKRLLSHLDKGKINFFFNFECYDLANGKEWECKIW